MRKSQIKDAHWGTKFASVTIGIDEGYIGQAEEVLLKIINMTDHNSEAVLSLSRFYENMLQTGMLIVINISYIKMFGFRFSFTFNFKHTFGVVIAVFVMSSGIHVFLSLIMF